MTYDEIMSLQEDPRPTRFTEAERVVLDYAAQVVVVLGFLVVANYFVVRLPG